MRNIFKCITAIAAIGFVSVLSTQFNTTGAGKAWAGQDGVGQHRSVLRIADTGNFPVTRKLRIGLSKSMMIELPREVRDVVVSDPSIVDAVVQTSTRTYLIGKKTGQANAFFFDADGQQLLTLELIVERDATALSDLLNRLIDDADIKVEMLNDTVILTGRVRNPGDAATAATIASRFVVPGEGQGDVRNSEKVVNLLVVDANEQVLLKVTIAEMERNTIKRIGVNWSNANFGDSGFIGGTQNAFPTSAGSGANNFLTGTFGPSGDRAGCFSAGGAGVPGSIGGSILPNNIGAAGQALNCLTKTIEAFERNGCVNSRNHSIPLHCIRGGTRGCAKQRKGRQPSRRGRK